MEISEAKEIKVNKGRIVLIALLSVLFLLLVFSFNTSIYFTFSISVCIIVVSILLTKNEFGRIDLFSILIYLIPIASLALFYAISAFTKEYFGVQDQVLIPFTLITFSMSGILLRNLRKNEIKYIFAGIFIGLAIICIINLSLNLYHYGAFYGFRYGTYYLYYDGTSSKETMSSIAYALCGFSVKNVPVQFYLIFPSVLLTGSLYFFMVKSKSWFSISISILSLLVSLLSFVLVLSKITLITFIIMLLVNGFLLAIFLVKPSFKKVIKIVSIVLLIIFAILFIFIFLNAQSNLTFMKNITESNKLFNYLFNTNRYVHEINILLNGVFSKEKIIGFPLLFDEAYESITYPSSNVLINQFMYGGIFAFIFFIILLVVIFYNFVNYKGKKDKEYGGALPIYFIVITLIFLIVSDVSLIDEFDFSKFIFTPTNPFFLMMILFGGYYACNLKREAKKNEK